MSDEWSVPAWAAVTTVGILVVLLVVAVVAALQGRARAKRRAEEAEASTAELRERLTGLEARVAADRPGRETATPAEREFVITSIGTLDEENSESPVPALPARAFADAVLRDTVVNAAALVHGVRRALSPEVRNRIRFEMKREIKRSRRERKVEVREALREYRARHRADPADLPHEGVA